MRDISRQVTLPSWIRTVSCCCSGRRTGTYKSDFGRSESKKRLPFSGEVKRSFIQKAVEDEARYTTKF